MPGMSFSKLLPRDLVASVGVVCLPVALLCGGEERPLAPESSFAREVFRESAVRGGLVVHVGVGDGRRTAAMGANPSYLVHGLDTSREKVHSTREYLRQQGLLGTVSVDLFDGKRLPYIENLVSLVVLEERGALAMAEVMRVLSPGGVVLARDGDSWSRETKPVPEEIDGWTHYLHDASNNAVADDTVVGPPDRLQWVGSPLMARHHDRMSSVSALVSTGGRVFTIFDEGSPVSILLPPRWTLIARDAFNGTVLWKRRLGTWHSHLWPLKSGPAQLPRRLVAAGETVYVTLSLDAPVTALDAASGETLRTFEATRATEEILVSDGLLLALARPAADASGAASRERIQKAYGAKYWDEQPRKLVAVAVDSGDVRWTVDRRVMPVTLAATSRGVFFHDGERVVALDRSTGQELWASDPVPRTDVVRSFFAPTLVVHDGVVLFAGGETAGGQTGSWYLSGRDTMTALSAESGKVLWTAYHPPSGYRSPEDLLVVDGLVWSGETTSGRATGMFRGRNLRTGFVEREFLPDVDTYWFHHRCYRGKATSKYLLMSRSGTEFVDVRRQEWTTNHWFRGACLYGVMPANGLLYAPQHPCACYLEAKLSGFNALRASSTRPRVTSAGAEARLEKGPAYDAEMSPEVGAGSWPTYRRDAARSGRASCKVPATLRRMWAAPVGGKLTSPVIAGGRVFVSSIQAHTLHALDARTGALLWSFVAGGRIDSPPTVYRGSVYFGSADGYVYRLRAVDGALSWRFRAAPIDERLVAFEQVESVWPVPGSVLIENGIVWCVAGRSMFLDGGLRLWRIDAETGRSISETALRGRDAGHGESPEEFVSWLNMPTALPDVLSSDGRLVYMRSQPFSLDGKRLGLERFPRGPNADRGAPPATQRPDRAHIFSPTGFRDDSMWHRSYWIYGSRFVSGWCGYYEAGKVAPSGRILVLGGERVYGFGRKPQYYRWTTPMEYHLFAAASSGDGSAKGAVAAEQRPSGFTVQHYWTRDVPLVARGLVLAGETLFVAGPPDSVDEPRAFRRVDDPQVAASLREEEAAIEGERGALLLAVRASDGEELSRLELESPPVFDGCAAAGGRLFVSAMDGRVVCLGGEE